MHVDAQMGTADAILDLVSSGTTLRENNLKEIEGGAVLSSQVSPWAIISNNSKTIQLFSDVPYYMFKMWCRTMPISIQYNPFIKVIGVSRSFWFEDCLGAWFTLLFSEHVWIDLIQCFLNMFEGSDDWIGPLCVFWRVSLWPTRKLFYNAKKFLMLLMKCWSGLKLIWQLNANSRYTNSEVISFFGCTCNLHPRLLLFGNHKSLRANSEGWLESTKNMRLKTHPSLLFSHSVLRPSISTDSCGLLTFHSLEKH